VKSRRHARSRTPPTSSASRRRLCSYAIYRRSVRSPTRRARPSSSRCQSTSTDSSPRAAYPRHLRHPTPRRQLTVTLTRASRQPLSPVVPLPGVDPGFTKWGGSKLGVKRGAVGAEIESQRRREARRRTRRDRDAKGVEEEGNGRDVRRKLPSTIWGENGF